MAELTEDEVSHYVYDAMRMVITLGQPITSLIVILSWSSCSRSTRDDQRDRTPLFLPLRWL